jgi:hypothetical protein
MEYHYLRRCLRVLHVLSIRSTTDRRFGVLSRHTGIGLTSLVHARGRFSLFAHPFLSYLKACRNWMYVIVTCASCYPLISLGTEKTKRLKSGSCSYSGPQTRQLVAHRRASGRHVGSTETFGR